MVSKEEAKRQLWERGNLVWKLDKTQQDLYESVKNSPLAVTVWLASRRLGKSHSLCVLALEQCLRFPNSVVKYVAPSQKEVRTIIRPLMRELLKDCPEKLRPEYKTQESLYRFPNGSEIQIAGTDNGRAESLRGGLAHLCLVDEAGFCDDLDYIVKSVLFPTITTTKGKMVLSSTPPKSASHDFSKFVEIAEMEGTLVKKTIYDNPRFTLSDIDSILKQYGGESSVDFRREYLCEFITDADSAVIPEFTTTLQAQIVKDHPRPPFFDVYVSADIGLKDLTVALFAYYDFKASKLIIEDEVVMNGKAMTTKAFAEAVRAKESLLWTDPLSGETKAPMIRVCDNNLILINDLQQLHGISFLPTRKDDADAALNNLRIMLAGGRILINPRCKTLIAHLKYAIWNKSRKEFGRSADHGHYDAVDALSYLVRNVSFNKNPYPAGYGMASRENRHYISTPISNTWEAAIKRTFGITKKT